MRVLLPSRSTTAVALMQALADYRDLLLEVGADELVVEADLALGRLERVLRRPRVAPADWRSWSTPRSSS